MRRLTAGLFLLILSSCTHSEHQVIVSQNLNVCAKPTKQFKYENLGKGVDYEYGTISNAPHELDFYIGFQPNFPVDSLVKLPKDAVEGKFYRAGTHGNSRLLQSTGKMRSTFILITGAMDRETENIIYSDDFFHSCKVDPVE